MYSAFKKLSITRYIFLNDYFNNFLCLQPMFQGNKSEIREWKNRLFAVCVRWQGTPPGLQRVSFFSQVREIKHMWILYFYFLCVNLAVQKWLRRSRLDTNQSNVFWQPNSNVFFLGSAVYDGRYSSNRVSTLCIFYPIHVCEKIKFDSKHVKKI